MQKSGARLREVGTTNRTHPDDYESAIGASTALLLKVHTSNYRVVGFSSDVELPALAAIGRRHGVPVMEDLGSGALIDLSLHGLPKEPVVAERVAAGADVMTFSGDKLLGGPQCGLLVGRADLIARMRTNPLHRALRCDKLTLAGLEATLRHYQGTTVTRDVPTLASFTRPLSEIEAVGAQAVSRLRAALGGEYDVALQPSTSQVGSGALPTEELPSWAVVVRRAGASAERLAAAFRDATPPIVGRIRDDVFLLDVRTVLDPGDLVPHWPAGPPRF
jgi:L-seryl-tRNA(Ser) seleniumtransferase